MTDRDEVKWSLFIFWIGLFVVGIVYLTDANANNGQYIGTLKSANVITKRRCTKRTSCTRTYYVGETFYKGNLTTTCLITRPKDYTILEDANSVANSKILGTKRIIWEKYNNHALCYDQSIKYDSNIIGGVCFGFAMLPIISFMVYFAFCVVVDFLTNIITNRHISSIVTDKESSFEV
uniref:Uncharacterized protein n=1 Tax=viral metagenome TaxID=1070528 RepID=A0A6C0BE24_9ZZZZ